MKKLSNNIDLLLLVAGTLPMTYQYLTRLDIPMLVYICSVFASVSLEVVLIRQIYIGAISNWSKAAVAISTTFLMLIAFASYVPDSLHSGGVFSDNTYTIIATLLEGAIHSVFAALILCVVMSKMYAHSGVQQHIQEYTKQVQDGNVCTICGKVYKTPSALKAHMTRVHSNSAATLQQDNTTTTTTKRNIGYDTQALCSSDATVNDATDTTISALDKALQYYIDNNREHSISDVATMYGVKYSSLRSKIHRSRRSK